MRGGRDRDEGGGKRIPKERLDTYPEHIYVTPLDTLVELMYFPALLVTNQNQEISLHTFILKFLNDIMKQYIVIIFLHSKQSPKLSLKNRFVSA